MASQSEHQNYATDVNQANLRTIKEAKRLLRKAKELIAKATGLPL